MSSYPSINCSHPPPPWARRHPAALLGRPVQAEGVLPVQEQPDRPAAGRLVRDGRDGEPRSEHERPDRWASRGRSKKGRGGGVEGGAYGKPRQSSSHPCCNSHSLLTSPGGSQACWYCCWVVVQTNPADDRGGADTSVWPGFCPVTVGSMYEGAHSPPPWPDRHPAVLLGRPVQAEGLQPVGQPPERAAAERLVRDDRPGGAVAVH
jgi:hypothetical protein